MISVSLQHFINREPILTALSQLHPTVDDHDRGLLFDLSHTAQRARDALKGATSRRDALRWLSLSAAPLGMLSMSGARAATLAETNTVFGYAETQYPQWFPATQSTLTSNDGYLYRYYPSTGNYIGVINERVNVYGPITGNTLVDVGAFSTYLNLANASAGSCTLIPDETNGPYPGDGTNSANGSVVNVLTQSGVVRQDIRSSFGSLSGTASGVPLTFTLNLVNTRSNCASLEGLAVYVWHCDAGGNYSLYSSGVTNQNYLRGVQVTNSAGQVTFTTIFPGCYSGRWPHIHFEVYTSLAAATSGRNANKISQLALPQEACSTVYNGDSRYSSSIRNLAAITLASDNVFGNDSGASQLATASGSVSAGYTAALKVGVAV